MSVGRARAGLAALFALGAAASVLAGSAPEAPTADHALVERVLRETGVARSLPGPSWSAYPAALGQALQAWLRSHIPGLPATAAAWFRVMGWVLLVVVGLCLLALLGLTLEKLWRARQTHGQKPLLAVRTEEAIGAPPARTRDGWRAELETCLAAGRIEEALEALWWWLACSIHQGAIDPAWTSRELLEAAGRADLRPHLTRLDAMIYGRLRPSVAALRGLAGQLATVLP